MRYIAIAAFVLSAAVQARAGADTLDLSGEWRFGYGDSLTYDDVITLPASMLTAGKGREVNVDTKWTGSLYDLSYYYGDLYEPYRKEGNIKFPFFLTPDKEYVGNAYYSKLVRVPEEWRGRRVVLHLERPHIETTVKVNGRNVGHRMSLSTPHEYDVTGFINPGSENLIEINVYNGIENVCVGQDSHSVTDQTQGNWNGIVGDISLRSMPRDTYVKQLRVFPDVGKHKAIVRAILGGEDIKINDVRATVTSSDASEVYEQNFYTLAGDTLTLAIDFDERMKTWDEHSPHLYRLRFDINGLRYDTRFGMRNIEVNGRDILLNGKPVYMRGTVENCCFPLTGYPPTDVEAWLAIFSKCKEYGLNHVRFHSYCPPEAAFTAADSLGLYLQPEGPSWPNHGVKLNSRMPIDQYLLDEGRAMIDAYGNHPSFVMMAAGNEPAGDWVSYTDRWVDEMSRYDSTKIYCGASVGGGWAWDGGSQYHVKGGGRGLAWNNRAPSSDDDYSSDIAHPRNFKPTPDTPENNSPIIAHELGQWCVFPDLRETARYTGPYKARNFEIFADLLERNGMAGCDSIFLHASGHLQTLCYKYEIERNLRTPGYAGFQLLSLNDYSGQGTALVGPLNVFWGEKGYVDAPRWRRFCSQVVPLARFPKFVFTASDEIVIPVEAFNAGADIIHHPCVYYTVVRGDGSLAARDTLSSHDIPLGKNHQLGDIRLRLDTLARSLPEKLTLSVGIPGHGENCWDFWVYPDEPVKPTPEGVIVTDTLDTRALDALASGRTVLLLAAGKVTLGSDIVQHYLPVFWNTSWFKMRPPHTTGASIDTSHPLFAHGFPTDDWGNINWWELLNRAQVINLIQLPADYQSPVSPIDTWHLSRRLGMIVEARVGAGRLFMTTIDLTNDLDNRVVARRMRNAIIDYVASADFRPTLRLTPEEVNEFFTMQTPAVEMFTDETPDELKPKLR